VYSQIRAEGDRYIYRIKQAGKQTIKLATTEDVGGPCTVTLQADYFDTQTVTIQQVGREFKSLNITNNRIAQGLGRSVNITFQLADEDKNAQKDVTVTLVNMAVNGKNTFTLNTGDSNAVTNNNGTYTIKNVVTADDPAGELKVAITAKGYSSREATFTEERPVPKFTTSLSKTRLGANAGEEVVLSFSSDDLVDGMAVTLELDGLKPTPDLPTRAVTRYVYTVSGTGQQNITLVTTGSTATSKTCSVQLKAEDFGFEDSETLSVAQSKIVTYAGTININSTLNFDNWLQTDSSHSSSAKFNVKVGGNQVDVTNWKLTYTPNKTSQGNSWNRKYYITGISGFSISDVSISGEGIDDETEVSITITITYNNNSRSVTYTSVIGSLGLTKK
jgi:serine/threonine protein phosphatase PrpC